MRLIVEVKKKKSRIKLRFIVQDDIYKKYIYIYILGQIDVTKFWFAQLVKHKYK